MSWENPETFQIADNVLLEKISPRALQEFSYNFYSVPEYKRKLRFGQAFMNEFFPAIPFPELFYEEDDAKARGIIQSILVDYGKDNVLVVEVEETDDVQNI